MSFPNDSHLRIRSHLGRNRRVRWRLHRSGGSPQCPCGRQQQHALEPSPVRFTPLQSRASEVTPMIASCNSQADCTRCKSAAIASTCQRRMLFVSLGRCAAEHQKPCLRKQIRAMESTPMLCLATARRVALGAGSVRWRGHSRDRMLRSPSRRPFPCSSTASESLSLPVEADVRPSTQKKPHRVSPVDREPSSSNDATV